MKALSFKQNIDQREIILLLRQFSTLISAGVPILTCCELLQHAQQKPLLRQLTAQIKQDIYHGRTIAQAFKRHQNYFNPVTQALIHIGEQTGKLETTLAMLSEHLEYHSQQRRQLKQILFYPCLILITSILLTLGMMLFIVPKFASLFQESHTKLPWITFCIFYLANHLKYGLILFVILLPIFFLWIRYRKPNYKVYLLRIPVLRHLITQWQLICFARILALTLSAGLPITRALHLITITSSPPLAPAIRPLQQIIETGIPLHLAMQRHPTFPNDLIQMTKIGEESGKLTEMLAKFADLTETETQDRLQRLQQLLEPLIILILGALIGVLVIGIYLPIFNLGNVL